MRYHTRTRASHPHEVQCHYCRHTHPGRGTMYQVFGVKNCPSSFVKIGVENRSRIAIIRVKRNRGRNTENRLHKSRSRFFNGSGFGLDGKPESKLLGIVRWTCMRRASCIFIFYLKNSVFGWGIKLLYHNQVKSARNNRPFPCRSTGSTSKMKAPRWASIS